MSGVRIRREGRAGRITLDRPKALNALTHAMCLEIEEALAGWAEEDGVALVLIDGAGERAFCAGGDLLTMYETGRAGDFETGRRFWRDEYRLNAFIAEYPKPCVSLLHGYTMGGGVGVGCHGSHRIVREDSRIAMPECAVGLVPDVGGSFLLAHAPGRLGEYLAATGHRMDPSDALLAGFADHYVPAARWPELVETLVETGDVSAVAAMAADPPDGPLMETRPRIDRDFAGATAADIWRGLGDDDWAGATRAEIARGCPLSVACAVELVRRVRAFRNVRPALEMEYRFTSRSASEGEFLEGIRAAIVDKDRSPRWRHADVTEVRTVEVANMLLPLGAGALWTAGAA